MESQLYHSFNARNLTLNEVANSFIPNSQFNDLIQLNHSLLLGPRGCGKTTLLKMLTPQANRTWNSIENNNLIELPFFGVYVPTDNQWKKQLLELEKSLQFAPDFTLLVSKVIVNTNIIKSIVNTFYQLLELEEREEDSFFKSKRNLCIDLIEIFQLEKPISPDLLSIEFSLRKRLSEINKLISKTVITKIINFGELPSYFFDDIYDLSSNSFLAFKRNFINDKSFKNSNFRWALCFDELELAPEWLQDNLLKQLRSREDQTILFKLTSTPIVKIEKSINSDDPNLEASTLNDYTVIRAWTYDQAGFMKWNEFADKLATVRIKKFFNNNASTQELFSVYDIERIIVSSKLIKNYEIIKESNWDSNFAKHSLMWNLIKYLALHDKSFRDFLTKNNISYLNPVPKDQRQMGAIFRKMKPIIIYRSQLIKNNKIIGRKNIPFYFGVSNIYEICDGNPRFLSGLLDQLLKNSNPDFIEEITAEKQSEVIYKISERYLEIISSHPDASIDTYKKINNLESLIKTIGNYFYSSLIVEDFKINPIGSFVVDKDIESKLLNIINLGVRLGAFVYINPKEAVSETGIIDKSFRLSYLLHPYFKLPIREYNARNLSNIIRPDKRNLNDSLNLFNDDL